MAATMAGCHSALDKKQLGYLLGRQGVGLDLEDGPAAVEDETLMLELRDIIANAKLSEMYLALARDLDVMEPRTPEQAQH